MAANYTTRAGNTYRFTSIAAGATATIEFDKPVKMIVFNNSSNHFIFCDSDYNLGATITGGCLILFPNMKGYPNKIYLKNNTSSAVEPCVTVNIYGDVANSDYFAEEA